MKETVQNIITALAQVGDLRYVADDAGQGDVMTTPGTLPFACPAALVAADGGVPGEHRTKDDIRERVTIGVRLYDAPGTVANAKAPAKHAEASLRIYDLRAEVIRKVEELGIKYSGYSRIRREDGMRELLLTFTTAIAL